MSVVAGGAGKGIQRFCRAVEPGTAFNAFVAKFFVVISHDDCVMAQVG